MLSLSLSCWACIFYNIRLQVKKDLEDANAYKNKIKDTNKKLEDKVKELEDQLAKNKSKMKSQKVQLEQLRKAQKARDTEEEGAKGKAEVGKTVCCVLHVLIYCFEGFVILALSCCVPIAWD